MDYLFKISGGIEEQYVFLQHWIARILQHPETKTGIALVIKSNKQGMGKNTLYNLLEKLIGAKYCACTPNLALFFDKHSNFRVNKFIICLNEINFADSKDFEAYLKDCITENYINLELKYKDRISTASYENYIILSNKDCPILRESSDRRYFVVDLDTLDYGSASKKDKYFSVLYKIIGSGDIPTNNVYMRCLYDYFMNIDISKYKLVLNINTEAGEEIKAVNLLDEFLCDLYSLDREDAGGIFCIRQSELFERYNVYLGKRKIKSDMNDITFSRKLRKYGFLKVVKHEIYSTVVKFRTREWKDYFQICEIPIDVEIDDGKVY